MNKLILLNILIIISSPWWWVVIQRNISVGLLDFILSIILFLYFQKLKSKKIFLSVFVLTIILFLTTIGEAFDRSILQNSSFDIQKYNKRHEFYASGLGKIYTNRFSLAFFKNYNFPISKLQKNFFANLDPNLYFFASHPRERPGVEEFKKYSPIFLPFFLIGIFYSIYILSLEILIYSLAIALISSIISPAFNLGPILFFPIVNYLITIGFIIALRRFRR